MGIIVVDICAREWFHFLFCNYACICSDSQLLNLCGCGSFLPYVEMAKLLRMRKVRNLALY